MELRNSGVESQSLDRSQKIDADRTKMVGVVADGGGEGVKVEVGNAGGGALVVKRKRGRPPKVQANAPLAKKSKEEDEEEDVCFICFDGGSLVLCDRRGCPKAYHPSCVKRDEAFFRSKAKWNCGWHICSMCEKMAHHMCYTCTYSLCKGCIRTADYVCVRGDKGFCAVCMKTIVLIENSGQGKEGAAKVDFDDKSSWEYLFKVYWIYLKGKLSLTLDELTRATNPWKSSSTISVVEPPTSHISASGRRSITSDGSIGNPEASEAKRRKTNEQTNGLPAESPSTVGCEEWASKELLEFVAHMKNSDTSVLSQFDVQALLLEYIKQNNLRDPRKKTQIICDSRLKNLFGKPCVGHIEMLKLLEFHFLLKEDSQKNMINITEKKADADNAQVVGNKERRNHRKGTRRTTQNKLDEYAAIDVHNMNLVYLRRSLMESLIEVGEKFREKVVGSIVQIRISGSDQKDDMYRLVQVVGTTKVDVPYKVGDKLVDVMLEVLNLDKKEAVSIDTISDQELSEDECRRLRDSIRCRLVRCFTVGEIQEKAMALQPLLLDDRIKSEMLWLNQLRDQASEKGHKKGVRECTQKLQRLKTPEERECRLREIPEVHSDPKMNPDYESDDTEEYFNNEYGEHLKPKFPWVSGSNVVTPQKSTVTPQKSTATLLKSADTPQKSAVTPKKSTVTPKKSAESFNGQPKDSGSVDDDSSKAVGGSKTEKDSIGLVSSGRPKDEVDCNGSTISEANLGADMSSSLSNTVSDSTPPIPPIPNNPSVNDDMWHYRDPNGNVQGPFSMVQLQRWSISGYFPADMRVWANREADSLLLADVLKEQFDNHNNKFSNQIEEGVNVPSSTVPATPSALNSVNLEKLDKLPENRDSSGQSSGQNWNVSSYNLNANPPSVASLTNESTEKIDIQNVPNSTLKGQDVDINTHISSPFTVSDAALVDLPNPIVKTVSHEDEKRLEAGEKEPSLRHSKLMVQDLGNPPIWSTTLSLVVGGAELPETSEEWGRYPTTSSKPEEWDSGRVSVSSLKPLEVLDHQVASTSSTMDQIMHSTPPPSSQPYNNLPSWHGLGETIEFSTLAEESVSDLLAEVDAMESRNGVPSPTSRRNSFLEDLFNGSIEDFSPTGDQGTRSDGFSSSFGLETKSTCVVSIPQVTNSNNMGFKWAEMGARQDMFDLNDSTRAETDEGERETKTHDDRIEGKAKSHVTARDGSGCDTVRLPEAPGGRMPKTSLSGGRQKEAGRVKPEAAGTKLFGGFPSVEKEEGEFVQPPLLPLPPPPPPLTMGLDVVDSRKPVSETIQINTKTTGRSSQGATSTGRAHAHTNSSRSGNSGRESHHRRSGGVDRYNSSNSPRDRGHHVEDSGGYSRSSRSSWSRQSSLGGSGGGGGGYSRPPSKVQRICKFYESGHCKKGSSCAYLHQER